MFANYISLCLIFHFSALVLDTKSTRFGLRNIMVWLKMAAQIHN